MSTLDIQLISIQKDTGRVILDESAFHIAKPPRRPARGRSADQLLIFFSEDGNAPLTHRNKTELLQQLERIYFQSTGSATAAMRTTAEAANQFLLDRNMKTSNRGLRVVGSLGLFLLKGDRLFIAQSGTIHIFVLTENQKGYVHEPYGSGQGLGLSRATALRFDQLNLQQGDLILISAQLSPTWSISWLESVRELPVELLRKQMANRAPATISAALLKPIEGSGKIIKYQHLAKPREDKTAQKASREAREDVISSGSIVERRQASRLKKDRQEKRQIGSSNLQSEGVQEVELDTPQKKIQREKLPPKKQINLSFIIPFLTRIGQAIGRTIRHTVEFVILLFRRMLPDESLFQLPSYFMGAIAVFVPLIIVSVASFVYYQNGRQIIYENLMEQVRISSAQALIAEDPNEIRSEWKNTVDLLNQLEKFGPFDEFRDMREQAYSVIDQLDVIERLDFQEIISDFPRQTSISRIVSSTREDLYMLNITDGTVFMAHRTADGFTLDADFICGPVNQPVIVEALVDIALLPGGHERGAVLLGLDGNGNLLECYPNGRPPLAHQVAPPDTNWGAPVVLNLNGTDAYILDPKTNAVWIYWGIEEYTERPRFFFDDQVPSIQNAIDISYNGEMLYVLHSDSHLTTCVFSFMIESQTRCEDPAIFSDLRVGREAGALIADANFTQLQFSPPPDPSIYLLDPDNHAVYHFSLRLVLQRQYRSTAPTEFSQPATAFSVSPRHSLFLAIGDRIFIAELP